MRMTSSTRMSFRPRLPAGWYIAKSSAVKSRSRLTRSARASPTAMSTVVLADGARPSGHASSTGPSSMQRSADRPSDLGRIRADDVVLALSQSGETEEVLRLIPALRRLGACLIAITERAASSLGRAADLCVALGPVAEACPLGLAPSASTTVLMAVGDALALLVSRMREFTAEDFALYHPAGSLGRKLTRVEEVMRTERHLRRAHVDEPVRSVFVRLAGPRRRSGAVLIVNEHGMLLGIFTDSDLARLFERRREAELDGPIGDVMTADPYRIRVGATLGDAVDVMKAHKISELPVVDRGGRLVGLIDVTDLIGLLPADFEE